MKIGVFDSGVGGESVAIALRKALPEHDIIFRSDITHLPYGDRPVDEIAGFVFPIITSMIVDGCELIVIACNTVSVTLSTTLRAKFAVPFVALDPMIKPAASLTKTGIIAVCATPTTLASPRYHDLKQQFAADLQVLEPDCRDWARMIENHQVDSQRIAESISTVIDQGADVIVLACTHYHWIEAEINELCKQRATVIQPTEAIIRRVQQLLTEKEQ